jgi:hypothetical protein
MKRKLLALLTALLLMATMITPAYADLLWEPRGNQFYESHGATVHNRTYLTNGGDGYVTVLSSPDSRKEVANIANGTRFFVVYTWTDSDDSVWGLGYQAGNWESEGWVNLADMALIYDHVSFEEDHADEFESYDGFADGLTEACAYSYPGGVYDMTVEKWGGDDFILSDCFDIVYTDENGLRWSYVGYYFGVKNFWVCIDDPMNENLGVETAQTVAQVRGEGTQPVPPAADVPQTGGFPLWSIPVVLIIVVALVTAVIVRQRKKTA